MEDCVIPKGFSYIHAVNKNRHCGCISDLALKLAKPIELTPLSRNWLFEIILSNLSFFLVFLGIVCLLGGFLLVFLGFVFWWVGVFLVGVDLRVSYFNVLQKF